MVRKRRVSASGVQVTLFIAALPVVTGLINEMELKSVKNGRVKR